jgi:hypothetical protein
MDLNTLKLEIETAKARARSLKTRRARDKAWNVVRDLRGKALELLYAARDQYATHSVKGVVRWFHEGDDCVSIRTAEYGTLWANPTSDAVSKSWYAGTCCVQYAKDQAVVLEIEIDIDSDRLCLQVIPRRVHGGTLDEARYAELCKRDDLAFFKYPGSNGVTGLFSNK